MEEVLELENGTKATLHKHPRHGLWSVSFSRGDTPKVLKGFWQSPEELKKRLDNYLQHRPTRNRTKIKEETSDG